MPAGIGTGTKQRVGGGIRGESQEGFPGGGNNGAEKAVRGVLHQTWDETQNWNWGKSMTACYLMTVRKKEDLDRRGSAKELGGGEGGESIIRITYEKIYSQQKKKFKCQNSLFSFFAIISGNINQISFERLHAKFWSHE